MQIKLLNSVSMTSLHFYIHMYLEWEKETTKQVASSSKTNYAWKREIFSHGIYVTMRCTLNIFDDCNKKVSNLKE